MTILKLKKGNFKQDLLLKTGIVKKMRLADSIKELQAHDGEDTNVLAIRKAQEVYLDIKKAKKEFMKDMNKYQRQQAFLNDMDNYELTALQKVLLIEFITEGAKEFTINQFDGLHLGFKVEKFHGLDTVKIYSKKVFKTLTATLEYNFKELVKVAFTDGKQLTEEERELFSEFKLVKDTLEITVEMFQKIQDTDRALYELILKAFGELKELRTENSNLSIIEHSEAMESAVLESYSEVKKSCEMIERISKLTFNF